VCPLCPVSLFGVWSAVDSRILRGYTSPRSSKWAHECTSQPSTSTRNSSNELRGQTRLHLRKEGMMKNAAAAIKSAARCVKINHYLPPLSQSLHQPLLASLESFSPSIHPYSILDKSPFLLSCQVSSSFPLLYPRSTQVTTLLTLTNFPILLIQFFDFLNFLHFLHFLNFLNFFHFSTFLTRFIPLRCDCDIRL
jgi:hypothetical protein